MPKYKIIKIIIVIIIFLLSGCSADRKYKYNQLAVEAGCITVDSRRKWVWPVAIAIESDSRMEQIAYDLSSRMYPSDIKGNTAIIKSDRNPVCCLWLEVDGWLPNPGMPGYVIIIQPGGGVIRATNYDQMIKAIDRLQQNAVVASDGLWLLPSYMVLANFGEE